MAVGIQLYSVSEALKKDFDGTLRAIADIGYRQIESSTTIDYGSRSPKQMRQFLTSIGLGWRSSHVTIPELESGWGKIIGDAHAAGVEYLIFSVPWIRDPARVKPLAPSDPLRRKYGKYAYFAAVLRSMTLDDWKWTAEFLNEKGEKIRGEGLHLGYHNHSFDFKKFGEVVAYDELLRLADPKLVTFELDCGWMYYAGYDPVSYLQRFPTYYSFLHIKDVKNRESPNGPTEDIVTTEVGSGDIDWRRIFSAARDSSVIGYYVEQEPPYLQPQLESARISYNYLSHLVV